MTALFFEGRTANGWLVLGIQSFGDPPAAISHNHKDGRDVYVTQVAADHATISKLPGGVDVDLGRRWRVIDPAELKCAEVFKRIEPGESVELMLKPDRSRVARQVRYRCVP